MKFFASILLTLLLPCVASAMRIASGTYTGNGTSQRISVGFRFDTIFVKGGSNASGIWSRENWSERTNTFNAQLSIKDAIAPAGDGTYFDVGAAPEVNASATTYYWFAIADTGEGMFETGNYHGNQLVGRVVYTQTQKQINALWIKRDTARAAIGNVYPSTKSTYLTTNAGEVTNHYILSLGVGQFTVDGGATYAPWVNENDGNRGEATQYLAWFGDSANCKLVSWTGDGTTNRTITTTCASDLQAALVWQENGARSIRFKTSAMPSGQTGPGSNSAFQSNELNLSGTSLVTGSSTNLNQSGLQYYAIVFGQDDGASLPAANKVPACAAGSGRKVIDLPGRSTSSCIDFGSSDTLKFNGAMSMVLMAQVWYYNPSGNQPSTMQALLARSTGTLTSAGATSWGIHLAHYMETTQGLCGPMFTPVVTDRQVNDSGPPDPAGAVWRSGIIPPRGFRWFFIGLSHDGNGRWKMFLDGKLVKQRDIDMATTYSTPNIAGGTGHRTAAGARWNGSAFVDFLRMRFALARIYTTELSDSQQVALYQRHAQGNLGVSDVTGFLEEWDAANASGTSLPATVNSANNGTITNGTIITL
jgi:hypothetical protein